jgi:thiamine-monophosphate kinase
MQARTITLDFHYLCSNMNELQFIDHIKTLFASLPANGIEGIGDDCAVLPIGGGESFVLTTDMLCEGVHFLRPATSARELGRKSLAVNLSDIAAMGAQPVATLLSLSLPTDAVGVWAEEFMLGYRDMSEHFGVTLVGGDTTRSANGITINVTAIGRTAEKHIKRRSTAVLGDVIFTAGELGGSGVGLRDTLAGNYNTPAAAQHRNPQPQVAEGIWLGQREEVRAMIDISDGLASDIRHILKNSRVGAEIDVERIPVALGADTQTAACGGEDYKLLFTVAAEGAERVAADFFKQFGTPIYSIGRITGEAEVLKWLQNGKPVELDWQGFEHY